MTLPAQTSGYRSHAPFLTEAEAARKAARLDVGRAELLGADAATVGGYGEFTLRFTVEYVLRLMVVRRPLGYAISFLGTQMMGWADSR